ncbi:hypothetical protein BGZ92_003603 [Podila epicladia]|nr:hypothetical protein BGZ92_003603 [Podila epicladia]
MFYNHPGPYFHLSYPRNCRVQPYNFMPPSLKNPPMTVTLPCLGRSKSNKDRETIFDPGHVHHKDIMPDSNLDPDSQFSALCNNEQELLARLRMQGSSNSINYSTVSSMAESIHNSKSKANGTNSSNSKSNSPSGSRNSSNLSSASKTDSNGSGHTFGDSRTRANLHPPHPPASLHPMPGSCCRKDVSNGNNNNNNNSSSKDRIVMQSHFAPRQQQNQQPPPGNPMAPAANTQSTHLKNNEGAHDDALICEKGERQAPWASTAHAIQASLGPSSSSSPVLSVLLDDMQLLKAQIMQATLVLTHVVQTMTVPSPSALLDFVSKRGLLLGKGIASDEGCNCAGLQFQHVWEKQSHGHGLHFLVANYSPDPWEFQNRVLRQIACMQQELDALRQESLDAQKRATIQMRKEVMEWERSRDVEWVELNERLQNTFLQVADDGEGDSSEYCRTPFKKGLMSDDYGADGEGKWVRMDESRPLMTKRHKEKVPEEAWKTKATTIHNTWAGAVTPLAGGPLFPNKVREEEGFGQEVFWAGDYASSQFSPIPSAPHSKEE